MTGAFRVPVLDVHFLQKWSPARFTVLGLAIYAVLLVISPLEYDYSQISLEGTLYAVVVLGFFFCGCFTVRMLGRHQRPAAVEPVSLPADHIINIAIVMGLVGVTARLYDRIVLRGFTVAETFIETRETLEEGLSTFSYIGGLFFSFGIVALMLIWLSGAQRRRPLALVIAMALTLYPMIEGLVGGSRSTMIHTAFLFYLLARSSSAMRWLVRSRAALLIAATAIIALSVVIYETRTLEGTDDQRDIADVFTQTAISKYAFPHAWVVDTLITTDGRGLVGYPLKTFVHVSQYLTHSWLAYYDSFTQFSGVHGWGRFHLNMVFRLLSAMLGEGISYDPQLYGMQLGVSTTTFSSIYYDFGVLGPLVAGVFGYLATVLQRKAIQLPERWLPLYVLVCFNCIMLMLDNQFLGGLGAFAVWSFGLWAPFHYLANLLGSSIETKEPDPLPIALTKPALGQQ